MKGGSTRKPPLHLAIAWLFGTTEMINLRGGPDPDLPLHFQLSPRLHGFPIKRSETDYT